MSNLSKDLPTHYDKAFKDADIRGVYPTEIDETVAYKVARAAVEECNWKTVLVARDMRVSSPALRQAFIAGVRDAGATAIDIGIIDTPGLYFASGSLDLPGVVITASHNPAKYNGLKLVAAGAIPLTAKTGLLAIKKRIEQNTFKTPKQRGELKKQSVTQQYLSYIRKKSAFASERPLKVVVDAGNGTAGPLMQKLCQNLPIKITPLFFELDGNFPNRQSNPTLAKNQTAIKAALKQGDYDFGVAFDGDADRVAFFDEKGNYINSSFIGALIVKHLSTQIPHSSFVYTVFTSRAYSEAITEAGGTAIKARVGHAFIKAIMRQKDVLFGCEHSAHFYFKDNYYTDSGILTFLFVAGAFANRQQPELSFSQYLKPFATYYQTEEVLVPVKNKEAALQSIAAHYEAKHPEHITKFDGVTVSFPDYWFVVKKSVTEDALKFVVESPHKKVAEAHQKEILAYLRNY
jgi:phosphomannomutase